MTLWSEWLEMRSARREGGCREVNVLGAAFLHREWWRWRYKAGRPLFFISRLSVLHLLFQQKYILAAQKSAGSCQMTSNANLHINVFATAPCTLERKGLRFMQNAKGSLIHYRSHYMESWCNILTFSFTIKARLQQPGWVDNCSGAPFCQKSPWPHDSMIQLISIWLIANVFGFVHH